MVHKDEMSEKKLFGYGNDDQIRSRAAGVCIKGDDVCRGKGLNSCWPCMMEANKISREAGRCVHLIRDEPACGPWGAGMICAVCRHSRIEASKIAMVKKEDGPRTLRDYLIDACVGVVSVVLGIAIAIGMKRAGVM